MKAYLDLMRHIRDFGVFKEDRTGTGTLSVFGYQMRFDLSEGFPLVTTKKCHLKSIIHELLWFLKGETNVRYLKENGVSIWDEWVDPDTAVYKELSVQERLDTIKKSDEATIGKVLAFFKKYEGNPELEAHEYLLAGNRYLINRNGYDFLPDFLDKCGIDDEKLVSGELGPVYGKQWRSWPNPTRPKELETPQRIDLWNQHATANFPYSGELLKEMADIIDDTATNFKPWVFADYSKKAAQVWGYQEGISKLFAIFDVPTHVVDPEGSIDQISNLIDMLKNNPDSRRLIVSAWNPAQVDIMALPPCHCLFQFYSAPLSIKERSKLVSKKGQEALDQFAEHILAVRGPVGEMKELDVEVERQHHEFLDNMGIPSRKLSCQLYQRSMDVFLGCPFNIASYALLTMMIAQVTNHVAGEFIHTSGDTHLYSNHLEQADLQLSRTPHKLPTMKINPEVTNLFDFQYEDFELVGYECDPAISAPVAV